MIIRSPSFCLKAYSRLSSIKFPFLRYRVVEVNYSQNEVKVFPLCNAVTGRISLYYTWRGNHVITAVAAVAAAVHVKRGSGVVLSGATVYGRDVSHRVLVL